METYTCCFENCQNKVDFVCAVCTNEYQPETFCEEHFKEEHVGRRKGHAKIEFSNFLSFSEIFNNPCTSEDLENDHKNNLLIGLFPDNKLRMGIKFHELSESISSRSTVFISFVAPTGNGKSALLATLLQNESCKPISASHSVQSAVSSDLHAYSTKWLLNIKDKGEKKVPVVLLDSEGLRGRTVPLQTSSLLDMAPQLLRDDWMVGKRRLVALVYPRLLYLFSDVLCYPFIGSIGQVGDYTKDILDFANIAAARTINNPVNPVLCIIFNRRPVHKEEDEVFRKSSDSGFECITRATELWQNEYPDIFKKLRLLFREVYIIHIPDFYKYPAKAIEHLELFQKFLKEQSTNSLSARLGLKSTWKVNKGTLPTMWKVATKLYTNADAVIDLFQTFLDDKVLLRASRNISTCFIAYWKAINTYLSNKPDGNIAPNSDLAFEHLKKRLCDAFLLQWFRLSNDLLHGESPCEHDGKEKLPKEFRRDWKKELHKLADYVMQYAPCGAKNEFFCASKEKAFEVECMTNRASHQEGHGSKEVYFIRSDGAFENFFGIFKKYKCAWDGPYEEKEGYSIESFMESIEDSFMASDESDFDTFRVKYLKALKNNEIAELRALVDSSSSQSTQACFVCLCDFPDTTLSPCGHSVCFRCYKEFTLTKTKCSCPFCGTTQVKLTASELPEAAGVRVLVLGGAGTSCMATTAIISAIEENLKVPIGNLFDIIVGSSGGGIIALYLANYHNVAGSKQMFTRFVSKVYDKGFWDKIASWFRKTEFSKGSLWNALQKEFPETHSHKVLGYTQDSPVVAAVFGVAGVTNAVNIACNVAVPRPVLVNLRDSEQDPAAPFPPSGLPDDLCQSIGLGDSCSSEPGPFIKAQEVGFNYNCSVAEAAYASYATNGIFPPISPKIDSEDMLKDAVDVTTNASEIAIALAKKIYPARMIDYVVSVVPTFSSNNIDEGPSEVLNRAMSHSNLLRLLQVENGGDNIERLLALEFELGSKDALHDTSPMFLARMKRSAAKMKNEIETVVGRIIAGQLYLNTATMFCASTFVCDVLSRSKQLNSTHWRESIVVRTDPQVHDGQIEINTKPSKERQIFDISFKISDLKPGVYKVWVYAMTKYGEHPVSGCPLSVDCNPDLYGNKPEPQDSDGECDTPV